jgi:hypothetical protein
VPQQVEVLDHKNRFLYAKILFSGKIFHRFRFPFCKNERTFVENFPLLEKFLLGYATWEAALAALLVVTFIVQLYYYLGKYGRVATYKQRVSSKVRPEVSVVVVVEDDLVFVQEVLPRLLAQKYDAFEVVVVDYGSGSEVVDTLEVLDALHPHLKTTRINPDNKFKRRRKLALTVGIKAARYPNILFTESFCRPVSDQWLSMMAKGFTTGEVVIGYTGIEPRKGLANRLIRCSRLMTGVRYLSSAVRGNPYKTNTGNMGFTSALYFENRGYNYLNLNVGDNDLFIGKIATKSNTAVVIHPTATVREFFGGRLWDWFNERRYATYTFRYYRRGVRAGIFLELFSRFLFFATAAAFIALQTPWLWIGAAGLIVLRWSAACFTLSRICLRLGEKGLFGVFFIHDLFSPWAEALLSISRRVRPSAGIWS